MSPDEAKFDYIFDAIAHIRMAPRLYSSLLTRCRIVLSPVVFPDESKFENIFDAIARIRISPRLFSSLLIPSL